MRIRTNLTLVNIALIIAAIGFATLFFVARVQEEAHLRAKVSLEERLRTFWQFLHAKGDDLRIKNGNLLAGEYVVNGSHELPDRLRAIFGGTAAIFVNGLPVAAVSTGEGRPGAGARLDAPAYDAIFRRQQPFRGEALILGAPHLIACDPIRDRRGETIGGLCVGVRKSEFLSTYDDLTYDVIGCAALAALCFALVARFLLSQHRRYEEALRKSEEKFRTLFHGSAEAMFLLDAHMTYVDCNREGERLLGCSRAALMGRSPLDFSPQVQPDGRPSAEAARDFLSREKGADHPIFSWEHLRADGTRVETEVSLKALSPGGKTTVQAVVRDVGARNAAERRLFEISRVLSEATGDAFFASLARQLARLLRVECAMIAELVGEQRDRLRTVAVFAFGKEEDILEFPVAGSVCGDVLRLGFCFHAAGARERYPHDRVLALMKAEGYVGIPLKDSAGTAIGLMAVLHRQPLLEREAIESVFRIIAVRAAGELERRNSESRLREMADRIRLVTDSVPASIAYIDAHLHYRFANQRYLHLFGLAGRDVVGLNVADILPDEVFAGLEGYVVKALAGREVTFVNRLAADEGRPTSLETTYVPHRDKGGRVLGIFIQHVDVTARLLAEQALRDSEERYRTVFDTTGNATFIVEEDTTVSFVNREFSTLTGYAREETEGKLRWTAFVTCEHRDPMLGYHLARRADPDSAPGVYECDVLRKDGTVRNVLAQVSVIPGTRQTVASFLDVTLRKEMENELQTQVRFLKALLDTIPSPVFYKNAAGAYLGCNHAFEEYIGMPAGRIVGRTVYDLAPSDLAQRYAEMDEVLFREPGIQVYESAVRYADGSRHDVVFNKATFTGSDGELGGLVGVILDVSERKRAEQLLAKEKLALEMIAGEAPLHEVLAFLCNNTESIMPGAFCSVLLLDGDGRRLRHAAAPSLPQGFSSAVDGTRIGPRIGSCGTAAFTGKRVIVSDIGTDPLWEKYRTLPLAFGLCACWSQPIFSSIGTVLGTIAVYYNTPHAPGAEELQVVERTAHLASIAIERSRAKQALQESEDRFHQLFAQNDDAIVLFRTDNSVIIDANPAAEELTGFRRDELRGREPSIFIATEGFRKLMDEVVASDMSQGFQIDKVVCIRNDGRRLFMALRAKILRLQDEYVVNCSLRDITEKIRLEEEIRVTQAKLIHADKMASLGMLASSIAHEINNPNNYIAVNASLLAETWQDAVPILRDFGAENGEFAIGGLPFSEVQELAPRLFTGIMEGSRRIATIVSDMKDYVRTDKRGLCGRVDVNRIIRAASTILWNHIQRYTDHFQLNLDEEMPAATGNAQQIEQAVINLVMNALQALPEKGQGVCVETAADVGAGVVVIRVRDAGKGMDEEVLGRATEPFYSTRIEEGGTGLGLYITASIIKEHGGTLRFRSAPGQGTTATIRLPMAKI